MADEVETEERLGKLEIELFQVKKMLHHKDEVQHQLWNDMQEGILELCQKNHKELALFRADTEVRLKNSEAFQDDARERLTRLESDMSEVKAMLRQALKLNG